MLVSSFNYDLPEERIAEFPPEKRGTTRLLVLNRQTGEYQDSFYANLDEFLNTGDVLILNDTKVMQARLFGKLPDGRERELIVLEKHGDTDAGLSQKTLTDRPQKTPTDESQKTPVDNSDAKNSQASEKVLYRGKLHAGDILNVANEQVEILEILGNGLASARIVGGDKTLAELAEAAGKVPLPPYLHRDATPEDVRRYQTVWAKNMGSAAAPTASLNMTEELLNKLRAKNVDIKTLTLHVGLGTFLPMRTENVEDHKMHSEWFEIPPETLAAIKTAKNSGGRVVALGTTVARTLEFYAKSGKTSGEDDIFIFPGFEFQIVDALLTNFHAPKSTVLMLAAAFAGWENLHRAYDHCVAEKYNFLSYGDSMLIC